MVVGGFVDSGVQVLGCPPAGIDHLPAHVGLVGGEDVLVADPLARGAEAGAQGFVAGDQIGECGSECLGVQRAVQVQDDRDVVDRRGALKLLKKPHPGLGKRQRHPWRALTGDQRRHRLRGRGGPDTVC